METRRLSMLFALLLAAMGTTAAIGQAPVATAPPAPQYQVEILIFANRDFDPSEEHFEQLPAGLGRVRELERREPPRFDDFNFSPLAPDAADELPTAEDTAFRFRLLLPEELQLTAQYRTLSRIPAYQLLLHGGWVQPGLPEEQSRPFDLSLLGSRNPRGSIRLHLSRFLHLSLDLDYQDAARSPRPVGSAFSNELSELSIAPRYRLVATRQARSGELHYFDHPALGVLVKVTPLPAATSTPLPAGARPAA